MANIFPGDDGLTLLVQGPHLKRATDPLPLLSMPIPFYVK